MSWMEGRGDVVMDAPPEMVGLKDMDVPAATPPSGGDGPLDVERVPVLEWTS